MKKIIALLVLCMPLLLSAGEKEHTTITTGQDPTIKVIVKGRAGNIELAQSGEEGKGHCDTDYKEGSGFVTYDRETQTLTYKPHTKYTLNRLASHIERVAPYSWAYLPKQSSLDLRVTVNSMGFGSFNFGDLNLSYINVDVRYGDLDLNFPTENAVIFRGTAKFHIHYGDLEILNLGNLKASKVNINGGAGEVSVDFGPKIYNDMDVDFDHDLGSSELSFPKGTKVLITGTSRDLSETGFKQVGKVWEPISYSENSPTLNLKVNGPMGDMIITWK